MIDSVFLHGRLSITKHGVHLMPKIIEKTIYTFDELSESAKEKARDWYRVGGFDYEWYDSVYEDAKQCAALIGITIDKIYFSGFSSQGDGACFEGRYSYVKGAAKALKSHAPLDKTLARIADELQALQRKNFYRLSAKVKHRGHYYHAHCTDIDVMKEDNNSYVNYADSETDKELCEILRSFMNWIYKQLEKEYEYLNSDESVSETILANEYTFDVNGKREGWNNGNPA